MARLTVRVTPRARRRQLRWDGTVLRLWVTAPPVEGAANAAVRELVADALALPPSAVRLVAGTASRQKILEVDLDEKELAKRLESLSS